MCKILLEDERHEVGAWFCDYFYTYLYMYTRKNA
jgi:hypothetical protein